MRIEIDVSGPRWLRLPRTKRGRSVAAVVVALVVAVPVAWASDRFSDVPNANPHHADINTIARAGITLGCNPPANNLYCPTDAVTRQTMASFLTRTLRAATPLFLHAQTVVGAIDFDTNPVLCTTTAHTPSVAEHALIHSWVSAGSSSAGLFSYITNTAYSTNGGTTWIGIDGAAGSRDGRDAANEHAFAGQFARLELNAGTSYMFAVRANRDSGTLDASEGRCEVLVEITYRDAGASSLGAGSPIESSGTDAP